MHQGLSGHHLPHHRPCSPDFLQGTLFHQIPSGGPATCGGGGVLSWGRTREPGVRFTGSTILATQARAMGVRSSEGRPGHVIREGRGASTRPSSKHVTSCVVCQSVPPALRAARGTMTLEYRTNAVIALPVFSYAFLSGVIAGFI